jgi:hypothetical protein
MIGSKCSIIKNDESAEYKLRWCFTDISDANPDKLKPRLVQRQCIFPNIDLLVAFYNHRIEMRLVRGYNYK